VRAVLTSRGGERRTRSDRERPHAIEEQQASLALDVGEDGQNGGADEVEHEVGPLLLREDAELGEDVRGPQATSSAALGASLGPADESLPHATRPGAERSGTSVLRRLRGG
jgi:hypothetical protein